jgi:acylphosphatase
MMAESSLKNVPWREYIVSGRVQGVGYRYFVMQAAARYGIKGRAKNLVNGKVRVRAGGSNLEEFARALQEGPRFARVDDIEVIELSESFEYENFRIE